MKGNKDENGVKRTKSEEAMEREERMENEICFLNIN